MPTAGSVGRCRCSDESLRSTPVNLRYAAGVAARAGFSLVCAGVSYSIWLAVFLLALSRGSSMLEAIGYLSAPVVTAAGFAAGAAFTERLTGAGRTSFLRIFPWPLIGCAVGAAAVFWFGPMLIVFGMFAAGTGSVALRELVLGARGVE
jgi:hypothetical protein